MKVVGAVKNAAKMAFDPFETLSSQAVKPILTDTAMEFGSLFGMQKGVSSKSKSIGHEELSRARKEKQIEEMKKEETKADQEKLMFVKQTYQSYDVEVSKKDQQIRTEVVELQSEIAKLAKTASVDTKAHLENIPKKVGVLDIRRLTMIVKFLTLKANEAKSANQLVSERSSKRTTGMLAWVSGKQMKIHEQGTLTLQG